MIEVLRAGLVLAGIGGSFALTYRLGYLNLAHGDLIVLGGLLAAALYPSFGGSYQHLSVPALLPVLLVAGLTAALVNVAIHWLVLDPLLQRALRMPQVLASLGASLAIGGALGLVFGVEPQGVPVPQMVSLGDIRPFRITDILLLAVFPVLPIAMERGRGRLSYRAFAANRALAGLWGVRLRRVTVWSASFAGALAALVGVEAAFSGSVQAGGGMEKLLLAFAGVLLGEAGGLAGMMAGAFVVGVVAYLLALFLEPWVSTMGAMFLIGAILSIRGGKNSR